MRVSKRAWMLLQYLTGLGKLNGWISVRVSYLADKFGKSIPTVKRWLGELFKAGRLRTFRRGPYPPRYEVIPENDTCRQRHLFTEQEAPENRSRERKETLYPSVVFLHSTVRKPPSLEKQPPIHIENRYGRREINPAWIAWRDQQFGGRRFA